MPIPIAIPIVGGLVLAAGTALALRKKAITAKQSKGLLPAPVAANQAALASGVALTGTNGVIFQADSSALPFNTLAGSDGPHLDIRVGDSVTVDIPTSGLDLPGIPPGTTGNALLQVTRVGPELDTTQPNTPGNASPQPAVFAKSKDPRVSIVSFGEHQLRRASITGVSDS